ncbi:putative Coiled-coil domain-containing protein 40 [Monocercomonoides exilis]|uniref:putative Coiled-coil domain-containing protein 40 n=1 Tax=Monocercomonoides exilis TaxID=2049356 RepID=UPI0035595026|nr:putative Coiled-coil domain-containing protein 40 [Monocercomonoides exilis]|eukprot:MONOS_8342.1-p1 / transcript=MONOS_8342.1 / gene=MONOS_8342 / organism=Monocercomonoides_exilis_PA203 / gene_product=Coiled-coil domain-containing protein 40 / transcript_product=Coiled-coil domain-containing protein 40 / location=Mono_scaffold00313:4087-7012(-) / protein_length=892 / sequence_SO=supercontig / SO=protein_coding / is_pseudo=false
MSDLEDHPEDDPEDDTEPLDPNNPIIARVQAQIKEQLTKQLEELKLQKYEKSGEIKNAEKRREDIGVELYSLQQELTNRYTELAQFQERFNAGKVDREKSDEDLKKAQDETDAKRNILTQLAAKVAKSQRELDEANEELMKLKHYNDTVVGEIAVARRDAYHTDETLMQQEAAKQEQDYLVNKLEAELRSLQDQYSLLEAQVTAQQKETEIARTTLAEANIEKENVLVEERQLMLQYNSTMVGVQRRDEALQQTEEALRTQKEQMATLNSEIIGYRNLIRQEEEKNEKQTEILSHVSGDQERLLKRIEQAKEQHERLMSDLSVLKKSADSVEGEVASAQHNKKMMQSESESLQGKLQKLQTEQIQVEDKISSFLDEQTSFDKFTKSTAANREKILEKVREKDLEAATVQNELECLKLDILNTQAHTSSIKKTLDALIKQLAEKDAIIEKFEVEIRRKNDEISKKQAEVDKLNRKYDAILQNKKEEDMGPLEATIHNLSKEIEKKKEECAELERNWMRLQMSLLSLMKQNDELDGSVRQLTAQETVLSQRKLRLEQQVKGETRELQELEEDVKKMYTQMEMLNSQIAKRNKDHDTLASSTIDLEARFVEKLRQLEEEAVKLEGSVEEERKGKEQMTQDIVECERQVLLWNRKIELEKETQSTLDTAGAESEIKEMEEEIHRMELRLQVIKKSEEETAKRMEQVVMSRASIAQTNWSSQKMAMTAAKASTARGIRGTTGAGVTTRSFGRTGGLGATKTAIKAQITDIQRKTRAIEAEVARTEADCKAAAEQQSQLQDKVKQNAEKKAELEAMKKGEQEKTTELLMEKQKNLDKLTRCQRFIKRYETELKGEWSSGVKTREEMEAKMEKEKERKSLLDEVIEELRKSFPFIHSLA